LPQIHTRTHARAVIAVLGLAACSGVSTSAPTTTAFTIDFGASPDPEKLLRADFAGSFTRGFQAVGLTITADQANCMANGVLNEFSRDELDQLMLDATAGKPDDPAALDRGVDVISGCLPADVTAALASRNG
jgi:hypothetical protein